MPFSILEISNYDGDPVYLYEIRRGNLIWRYCGSDHDVTVMSQPWKAVPISDSGITQSGEADGDTVKITLPAAEEVCKQFEVVMPSDNVFVTMRKWHEGDYEAPIVWLGTVTGVNRPDVVSRVLLCNTLSITLSRGGLRLSWGRQCPYVLYDQSCKADKNSARAYVDISYIDNATVHMGGNTAGLAGGYIEWPIGPDTYERRMIESAVDANTLVIFGSAEGMQDVKNAYVYPGCDRTVNGCKSHNNLPNYGGFTAIPGKSPFDGDPVF